MIKKIKIYKQKNNFKKFTNGKTIFQKNNLKNSTKPSLNTIQMETKLS